MENSGIAQPFEPSLCLTTSESETSEIGQNELQHFLLEQSAQQSSSDESTENSSELNENGDIVDAENNQSSSASEEEDAVQMASIIQNLQIEESTFETTENLLENTLEENLLCSFAVQNNITRTVMEELVGLLRKNNFQCSNLKQTTYKNMRMAWNQLRPLNKKSVIISVIPVINTGSKSKEKKKRIEEFMLFNPLLHQLTEKIEVKY